MRFKVGTVILYMPYGLFLCGTQGTHLILPFKREYTPFFSYLNHIGCVLKRERRIRYISYI
jgi:hypothetical protein